MATPTAVEHSDVTSASTGEAPRGHMSGAVTSTSTHIGVPRCVATRAMCSPSLTARAITFLASTVLVIAGLLCYPYALLLTFVLRVGRNRVLQLASRRGEYLRRFTRRC